MFVSGSVSLPSALVISCFISIHLFGIVSTQSISKINGNRYLSPYRNQNAFNVSGTITAIGPDGVWMRSLQPDDDERTSESIYVYGAGVTNLSLATGDNVVLDGRVSEFRSSATYLFLTEITRPANIRVVSKGNDVEPIVLYGDGDDTRSPPTEQYTALDDGDVFGLPGNRSQISTANPILQPGDYGLDFWESLSGELVTVFEPVAVAKPNRYGDTWIVGSGKATGQNSKGGLTLTPGDANPEAILIGSPLDGTRNPTDTKLGDKLEQITGVLTYSFGTYRILPQTSLRVIDSTPPALPDPVEWEHGQCDSLSVGSYNVENLAPNSTHLPAIAEHIVNYLGAPDLVFVQEIQDDNGPTNDDVVSANLTLETLVAAIASLDGGIEYSFTDINPVDDQDGGQPGGNIRVAYLYNSEILTLRNVNPGSSTDTNQVIIEEDGNPGLKYNPGLLDPQSTAWEASRKPLVAQWELVEFPNSTFFTINVHFTSKGGSSPIEGDACPPINGGVNQRIAQANLTAQFIGSMLNVDSDAKIIVAGDFNEFAFVAPLQVFVEESGMIDMDVAAGIEPFERYTYLFDMNSQELDHMYVSEAIADRGPKFEHVHINTWVSFADQISDHDPSVALLDVC